MDIREKAKITLRKNTSGVEMMHNMIHPKDCISAMLHFAQEMCELQKKECAESVDVVRYTSTWLIDKDTGERYTEEKLSKIYEHRIHFRGNGESWVWLVDKESILNCDNVCKI